MTIKLTSQQEQIVRLKLKPATVINVVGGPQCGKTITLINKIIHHITNDNLNPNDILVLTLTNRNVDKIIQFAKLLLDQRNDISINWNQLNVMTFHGLANQILSNNIRDPNILCSNVISGEYEWQLLYQLAKSHCNNTNVKISMRYENQPKQIKNKGQYLENMIRMYQNNFNRRHLKFMDELLIKRTINIMNECKIMTNDDLIRKAVEVLNTQKHNSGSKIKDKLKYRLILIDDSQDLYPLLLPFIEQVLTFNNAQLVLFGDPNQKMYQFMGGNTIVIKQILEINDKNKYINTSNKSMTYNLDQNFSNSPEIINFAKDILLANSDCYSNYEISTLNESSNIDPQLYNFKNSVDQLEFIVKEICKIMTSGVTTFGDIAILSRTNLYVNEIINHLKLYGIPCEKLSSKPEWVTDLRIQFIINLFKIIEYENNPLMNCNFPVLILLSHMKGIGNKSLQTLYHYCLQNRNVDIWEYFLTTELSEWDSSIFNKTKVYNYLSSIKKHIHNKKIGIKTNEIMWMINDIIMELNIPLFTYDSKKDLQDFKSKFIKMMNILQYYESVKPNNIPLITYFLSHYLSHDLENISEGSNKVKISTMHSAKSLNSPIVFLANPPHNDSNTDFPINTDILYTSITRGRNLLYLMDINHPRVNPDKFGKISNIALYEPFWKYFLNDKRRRLATVASNQNFQYNLAKVYSNQNFIQNKFGIRFLTTMVNTPKYFNKYKRLFF